MYIEKIKENLVFRPDLSFFTKKKQKRKKFLICVENSQFKNFCFILHNLGMSNTALCKTPFLSVIKRKILKHNLLLISLRSKYQKNNCFDSLHPNGILKKCHIFKFQINLLTQTTSLIIPMGIYRCT